MDPNELEAAFAEGRGRARDRKWIAYFDTLPADDLLFIVGAASQAVGRKLGMTEGHVLRMAAELTSIEEAAGA